jgi:hypothetical protein
MNLKIFLKHLLFRNKLGRFFVLLVRLFAFESLALLLSVFFILAMSFIFVSIPGLLGADMSLPPPGVDDLGWGVTTGIIIMVFSGISLCFSLPLVIWIHIYIFKKFFIRRSLKPFDVENDSERVE